MTLDQYFGTAGGSSSQKIFFQSSAKIKIDEFFNDEDEINKYLNE